MPAFDTAVPAMPPLPLRPARAAGPCGSIQMTETEVDKVLLFLNKARTQAGRIRDNAPAGSYMEKMLTRTIGGIDRDMAELKYLLAKRDLPTPGQPAIRPAI